jgi:hypothetical protein
MPAASVMIKFAKIIFSADLFDDALTVSFMLSIMA